MNDTEIKGTLRAVLEFLKLDVEYIHQQQGWIIAVAETIEKDPNLAAHLKRHPFYSPGPSPVLQNRFALIQRIDQLIEKLRG